MACFAKHSKWRACSQARRENQIPWAYIHCTIISVKRFAAFILSTDFFNSDLVHRFMINCSFHLLRKPTASLEKKTTPNRSSEWSYLRIPYIASKKCTSTLSYHLIVRRESTLYNSFPSDQQTFHVLCLLTRWLTRRHHPSIRSPYHQYVIVSCRFLPFFLTPFTMFLG